MLGYGESEVGDSPEEWFSRIHPEDLDPVKINLSAHLQGLSPHFESEHRMRHKDGSYRWVLMRGLAVRAVDMSSGSITRGPSLSAYRMAGSQSDITDRKRAEDQLLHDAFHDALTGLPNRALFLDRLGRAMERHVRFPDNLFAVLFLDLDRFKVINDSLGHAVGDLLLISIANRLKVCLRGSDTVARLGGDEFVILLEDFQDSSDAVLVAERVLGELKLPFLLKEHEVVTSASIGIVVSGVGYERPADVLRDADISLYRAKAQGRDRYAVFEPSLRTLAIAQLELESELRVALERRELHLHYQVIRSLKYDRITGFEALLRWKSPTRGNVSPVEFIPAAEETGLIVPIGEWVLREACRQLREWQEEFPCTPPLTINVNISGIQFSHPGFVDLVKQILLETGLEAGSLRLEITESVFMENAEQANRTLLQLRDLGLHLQIDDFGTGYSSLAYLQQFPISTIKIDRSFISRIGSNGDGSSDGAEIVKTIVALARELGMDSIAEGVETEEQLQALKLLNCEYGQGFYLARPVDSQTTEMMLAKSFGRLEKLHSGEFARRL
jgi:diguanylate cyclase (GGDEF)-like protein/PAS domain S-box-containing protein